MNILFKPSGRILNDLIFYTWSDYWAKRLSLVGEELSNIETTLINIDPNEPYGLTYSTLDSWVPSQQLCCAVDNLADMLVELNPAKDIIVFEKLLLNEFTSKSLHSLFSLLSMRINEKHGFPNYVSLHSPIKSEACDRGFPVHADLFKSRAILNIISRNDEFHGGDILLISLKDLSDAMYATRSMPTQTIELIKERLNKRTSHDEFDYIFDLIHGDHPWVNDLESAIESRQICIPGSYGMGYFVIDGQWLHGRTKIHGSVSNTRLERLVFDTKCTMCLQVVVPTNTLKDHQFEGLPQTKSIYKAQKSLPNKAIRHSKSMDYKALGYIESV
jgi:hypothetical protein